MIWARLVAVGLVVGVGLSLVGCGSSGSSGTPPPVTTYVLTVNSTNPSSGVAIGVSPADNNGATNGTTSFTRTYNSGTSVTLTAPSTSGSNTFSSWTGCTTASTVTCTVSLTANTTITANYTVPSPTTYTLTVDSTNPASGVAIGVSPADNSGLTTGNTSFTLTYNSGTAITLTAPATSSGNAFSSWTGCTTPSTTATCMVTLTANTTVTANYTVAPPPPTTYTLTVDSTNPSSGVAITVTPADNNGATNGTTSFTRTYNSGTSVTLTAPSTLSSGNTLSSWTGCTTASTVTCTVSLTANTTITANYTVAPPPPTSYTLTVDSTNPASGVAIAVSPADNNGATYGATSFTRIYNPGTSVILTAPSTSGSNIFSSWTGCATVSTVTCKVTLSANTTVTANYTVPAYTLTVDSTYPSSGASINVIPADNNNLSNGTTSFTRTYNAGTQVTLTASSTAGGDSFDDWTGCTTTSGQGCNVTVSGNTTVTANYAGPSITSVTITPSAPTVTIGTTQQFTATVAGTGSFSSTVTWSLAAPSGSTESPGTLSTNGLYTTPYPAPATVTVKATSTEDTTKSATATITLTAPATAAGPALSVDAGNQTHAISPNIYGMNAYLLDSTTATNANITVARMGGDDTSRYNYQTNVVNSADDYYFENGNGSSGMLGGGLFNGFVSTADGLGIQTIGTAPVIGWVSNSTVGACSFTKSAYPDQQSYNGVCGNGVDTDGTTLNGDSPGNPTTTPALTSIAEPPPAAPATAAGATAAWADSTWIGGWVNCLVTSGSYCSATGGKDVTIWDLDNEPEYWSAVHRDVHPIPMTYDEITNGGIGTALAIKTADPNALVSGPIISGWYQYFYSQQDVNNGYGTGPCYAPWGDPTDREAHGGVPLIEYYMQQMDAASATYGIRLLDYVDIHAYFEAHYNGNLVGLTTAGDTGEQQARMNSTRVFWDPTYTDPTITQPNYPTDPGYDGTNCNIPLVAPEIIPRMQNWVTNDYPGTKTSIDEYNFGGNESINGAVTQADILGIFGEYGLDMAALWPTTNYTSQVPGTMAFEIYRNYDGNNSTFGDTALSSTSANQGTLSVYGALRSSDGAITIIVINKTYGPLTSTISLANYPETTAETAESYLYSNANLNAIVAQPGVTITPPASGSTTSTIAATFPAQSITLLVVPAI